MKNNWIVFDTYIMFHDKTLKRKHVGFIKDCYINNQTFPVVLLVLLAVQDSSIGDLVTHSLTHSVSQRLLISATSEHYNDNNHYNHYNHYSDTTLQ